MYGVPNRHVDPIHDVCILVIGLWPCPENVESKHYKKPDVYVTCLFILCECRAIEGLASTSKWKPGFRSGWYPPYQLSEEPIHVSKTYLPSEYLLFNIEEVSISFIYFFLFSWREVNDLWTNAYDGRERHVKHAHPPPNPHSSPNPAIVKTFISRRCCCCCRIKLPPGLSGSRSVWQI